MTDNERLARAIFGDREIDRQLQATPTPTLDHILTQLHVRFEDAVLTLSNARRAEAWEVYNSLVRLVRTGWEESA